MCATVLGAAAPVPAAMPSGAEAASGSGPLRTSTTTSSMVAGRTNAAGSITNRSAQGSPPVGGSAVGTPVPVTLAPSRSLHVLTGPAGLIISPRSVSSTAADAGGVDVSAAGQTSTGLLASFDTHSTAPSEPQSPVIAGAQSGPDSPRSGTYSPPATVVSRSISQPSGVGNVTEVTTVVLPRISRMSSEMERLLRETNVDDDADLADDDGLGDVRVGGDSNEDIPMTAAGKCLDDVVLL